MREFEDRVADALDRYDDEMARWQLNTNMGPRTFMVQRWPDATLGDVAAEVPATATVEREFFEDEKLARTYIRHAAMKAALDA